MVQNYQTQLVQKIQLTETVWFLKFSLINPASIDFVAGQFLVLKPDGKTPRSYSILSPDFQKNTVDFVVHMVPNGIASNYFRGLKVGDNTTFMGPAGVFTLKESTRDKIFLATGTGIAPMFSMLYSHYFKIQNKSVSDNSKHQIFWGVETRKDVYLADWLENIVGKWPNLKYQICLSRETDITGLSPVYKQGRINGNMTACLAGATSNYDYYICGGREVVESLRSFVAGLGVPKEQIYFERF